MVTPYAAEHYEGLLQLGFTKSSERLYFCTYKIITGLLNLQIGSFHIDIFKVPRTKTSDLTYMLEIVDYYHR
ncbi:hypothetical protein CLV58_12469 [Spirosoma oryzae]|uniref:Uncharacterized protein n=1 Tax=Spirosoma oryzae TaxID=1469603 RepID=A0A2T0SAK5_9BACT|nr:hypothetical protein CLV58_12469 [Spirosoma oryzae]